MTKVTPTFDTILTVMTLTSILKNRYDLKRAGLPKRHREHKQTLKDKGKWKEERKDVYYHGHNSPTKKTYKSSSF